MASALGIPAGEVLDLSQTMNPFAPEVTSLVARHLDALHTYPDPQQGQEALADALGVPTDRVVLTNGGAEAIHLVAQAVGGRPRSEPEFALHPRNADGPVWRSDPHSPSGVLATSTDHADIWDEAFYPLATGQWTARRDGIVVGSLTKTFACPGLRLGYVLLAADSDPDEMRRYQPHWAVNALALACLPEMLDSADLGAWAEQLAAARDALVEVLAGHHLTVRAEQAPWVLAAGDGGGTNLRAALAPYAVVVRDCASFGMTGTYRVAVPDATGLRKLQDSLERAGVDGHRTDREGRMLTGHCDKSKSGESPALSRNGEAI